VSAKDTIYNVSVGRGLSDRIARYVVAMSRHETGDWEHDFYTIGNNGFGYSYDKNSRWQLDRGGRNADNGVPIAQYRSIEDSTNEVLDWIRRRQSNGTWPKDLDSIGSIYEFAQLLKNGSYYEAPVSVYSSALFRHFQELPNRLGLNWFGLIVYLVIIYFTLYYIFNGRQQ